MTPPALCKVIGYVYDLDGAPNPEVHVVATVESTEEDLGGQLSGGRAISSRPVSAFTDKDGRFELSLAQGARVLLSIPAINLRKQVAVPALSEVELAALI
jgi:hypothetical protein